MQDGFVLALLGGEQFGQQAVLEAPGGQEGRGPFGPDPEVGAAALVAGADLDDLAVGGELAGLDQALVVHLADAAALVPAGEGALLPLQVVDADGHG